MNKITLIIAGFLIISCGSFNEANGQGELHLNKSISTGQELIDLQEAFDKGIINESEFETIKNRIVEGDEVFVIDIDEKDDSEDVTIRISTEMMKKEVHMCKDCKEKKTMCEDCKEKE